MPVVLTGPKLPLNAPLGFCAICAAQWKASAFADQGPAVTEADRDREHTTVMALQTRLPPPAPAVAFALVVLPAPPGTPATGTPVMAPLPACWTHLQAVEFMAGGLILPPPGAVLLDGSGPHT